MTKDTCKFYNGAHHNKCCKAGVEYRSVTTDPDNKLGIAFRKPCVDWGEFQKGRGNTLSDIQKQEWSKRGNCSKREVPTEAEIEAFNAEMKAHLRKMEVVFQILPKLKSEHKGKDWSGVMECPACKGRLHVGISACNGHTHGRCETEGCASWIE